MPGATHPRLRVLHVLCDLSGGGAERLVLDLCRLGPDAAEVAALYPGGALEPAFAAADVPVHPIGLRHRRPDPRRLRRLAALAAGFDVVHTHLWAGDVWGRLAGALAGAPLLLSTAHNDRPDGRLRGAAEALTRPLARRVVAVSRAAAAGAPRSVVIENGIDLSRFSPARPRPGFGGRLLSFGRLTRQKGFDLLAAALPACPRVQATVLGEGADRAALAATGVLRLPGWTPDVRPWLAAADLVALPSRWEGFGLAAVEAMAAGVPVIATSIPAFVAVVGDAGLLVPPADPAALAAAIRRLSADAALRQRLSAAGLARAARYDARITASRYAALYRELLGGASRGRSPSPRAARPGSPSPPTAS